MKIAIATCMRLPEPDPDQHLLLEALRRAGHDADLLAWDDPQQNEAEQLRSFDLIVLRSTWNYPEAPEAFRAWIGQAAAATAIVNPPAVLLWNMHKGYLRELQHHGVPVAETLWIDRSAPGDLPETLAQRGWNDVIIKPAVSAGSMRTRKFTSANGNWTQAQAFLDQIARDSDVMVQRFLPSVLSDDSPETAIVWIAGAITHVIHKRLRMAGEDESVSAAQSPTQEQLDLATTVLAAAEAVLRDIGAINSLADDLLYARIDVMRDDENGALVLSELELLEPSLFLQQSPAALERFVCGVESIIARE